MYENIKICKHGNIQIYIQKNKSAKNVKGYVKKVNIYKKLETIETLNQTNKEYIKATNI